MTRSRLARIAALLLAPALGGCGERAAPMLSVTPRTSGIDAPLTIAASGFEPGEPATLEATLVDAGGVLWRSRARFEADTDGRIDTARSPALGGTYTGRDRMGLLWSMEPEEGDAEFFVPAEGATTLAVSVRVEGRRDATRSVDRVLAEPDRRFTVRRSGLSGALYRAAGRSSGSAVLVIGGSEGGLSTGEVAAVLASRGHTALALAYFGAPGLPARLERIPLEYFARGLRRLRSVPGVDPERVTMMGVSRGSEAALLVAARFPQLIGGAIALVPSSVVNSAPDASRSAWSLGGRPLAFVRPEQFGNPALASKAAVIPVEDADAPILTIAGDSDAVWPSDQYADAIRLRLEARSRVPGHRTIVYRGAGHGIGAALPYLPRHDASFGGSARADATATADLWPRLLRFLQGV